MVSSLNLISQLRIAAPASGRKMDGLIVLLSMLVIRYCGMQVILPVFKFHDVKYHNTISHIPGQRLLVIPMTFINGAAKNSKLTVHQAPYYCLAKLIQNRAEEGPHRPGYGISLPKYIVLTSRLWEIAGAQSSSFCIETTSCRCWSRTAQATRRGAEPSETNQHLNSEGPRASVAMGIGCIVWPTCQGPSSRNIPPTLSISEQTVVPS